MGIGVSVFLIAVGAILAFAVSASVNGISIETIGVILMIVGGIGLLWSALVMGMRRPGQTVLMDDDRPVTREVIHHRTY